LFFYSTGFLQKVKPWFLNRRIEFIPPGEKSTAKENLSYDR